LAKVGADLYGGIFRQQPELLAAHGQYMQPPHGLGYIYQMLAACGWSSLPWLWTLPQPTLVMHGNDDPIVPLANAGLLAAMIPDARLHVLDDGHLFPITRAAEVASVMHELLAPEAGRAPA